MNDDCVIIIITKITGGQDLARDFADAVSFILLMVCPGVGRGREDGRLASLFLGGLGALSWAAHSEGELVLGPHKAGSGSPGKSLASGVRPGVGTRPGWEGGAPGSGVRPQRAQARAS